MYTDGWALAGRVGVVVGAGGGGHGTAITQALVEAGATIAAWDFSQDALDELMARQSAGPGRIVPMRVDACDSAQVEQGFERVVNELGPLHSLTHVVGGTRPGQWGEVADCADETFCAILQHNLFASFYASRGAARRMREAGGGSIVNISSVSGLVSAPEHGPYGAAKAAMVALTRTMAIELSAQQVRVNVVAPGAMSVPRLAYLHSGQPGIAETIPLGQRGTPFDVAAATLFLHSGLAGYITGQVLAVDGGLMAKTPYGGAVLRRMTQPATEASA
jgi:NAD(P)-dependent dehydrogenase (short-subunit alcohol dehydrogenase family)